MLEIGQSGLWVLRFQLSDVKKTGAVRVNVSGNNSPHHYSMNTVIIVSICITVLRNIVYT